MSFVRFSPFRISHPWAFSPIPIIVCLLLLLTTQAAAAETIVPGATITTDTTWPASGSPYVINGDLMVASGATFTLEPGVQVKFNTSGRLVVQNGATLIAAGTADAPVTITSNAATPGPGNWQYILFDPGSHGRLDYCTLAYAGAGSSATLYVDSSDVQMRNCALADGLTDGIHLRAVGMTPLLENVTIRNHGGRALYQTHADMSPTYTNLAFTGNGTNAIVTEGGNIAHVLTLDGGAARLNGSPYIVNGDVVVNAGYTLTVSPGTAIRWAGASRLVVQTGATLIAAGTATTPVTFTTNAITPTAGSWQYILFDPGSRGLLSHCTLQYAGAGNNATLLLDTSDVQVRNCTLADGARDGIQLRAVGMTPLLENVTIRNHGGRALYQTHVDMSPTCTNLIFTGNGTNAVVTEGGNIGHALTLDGGAARLNGSPYIVNGDVVVNASRVLTVSPGTAIRWAGASRLVVQNGAALIAAGTATTPVTFTTNAITPTRGSWQYILFDPGSRGLLSHCTLQYAGAGNNATLLLDTSDVQVRNCTLADGARDGIQLRAVGMTPLLENVTIRNHGGPRTLPDPCGHESDLHQPDLHRQRHKRRGDGGWEHRPCADPGRRGRQAQRQPLHRQRRRRGERQPCLDGQSRHGDPVGGGEPAGGAERRHAHRRGHGDDTGDFHHQRHHPYQGQLAVHPV